MATQIEMFAGDTKRIVVVVKDDTGAIVNLVGPSNIKFQMVEAPSGRPKYRTSPVVVKDISSNSTGIDVSQLISGIITVTLFPVDTRLLKGQYYYELEYTDEDGDVSTVVNGILSVKESIIA